MSVYSGVFLGSSTKVKSGIVGQCENGEWKRGGGNEIYPGGHSYAKSAPTVRIPAGDAKVPLKKGEGWMPKKWITTLLGGEGTRTVLAWGNGCGQKAYKVKSERLETAR